MPWELTLHWWVEIHLHVLCAIYGGCKVTLRMCIRTCDVLTCPLKDFDIHLRRHVNLLTFQHYVMNGMCFNCVNRLYFHTMHVLTNVDELYLCRSACPICLHTYTFSHAHAIHTWLNCMPAIFLSCIRTIGSLLHTLAWNAQQTSTTTLTLRSQRMHHGLLGATQWSNSNCSFQIDAKSSTFLG